MDTGNVVALNLTLHHVFPDLAGAELAPPIGSSAAAAPRLEARAGRLERARADRELILQPVEAHPAPPWSAMPAVTAGTTVLVDAVPLPSQGWAEQGEPPSQTGPVEADRVDAGSVEDADSIDGAGSVDDVASPDASTAPGQGVAAFTSSTVTKRELSFLDDRSLSIEEKLFRFMALMTKKADQDLVAFMKEVGGKSSSTSSSGSSSSSGTSGSSGSGSSSATSGSAAGSADGASSAGGGTSSSAPAGSAEVSPGLPPPYNQMTFEQIREKYGYGADQMINLIQRGDPNADAGFFSALDRVGPVLANGAAWAAQEFAGPALAYGVTALGMPELAPIAKSVGRELGDVVGDGLRSLFDDEGTKSTGVSGAAVANAAAEPAPDAPATPTVAATATSTSSSGSSSAATSVVDERLQVMNLQRLVEKQNAMFDTLSNVLKSLHDSRMAAIQNLR